MCEILRPSILKNDVKLLISNLKICIYPPYVLRKIHISCHFSKYGYSVSDHFARNYPQPWKRDNISNSTVTFFMDAPFA